MQDEAEKLGADGVINVEIEEVESGDTIEIKAFGTAIKKVTEAENKAQAVMNAN